MKRCLVVVLVIVVLGLLGNLINQIQQTRRSTAEREADNKEAARITFAAEGAKRLRNAMRNPDSFKLAKVLIMGDGTACYDYRAQNGFGGMNAESAVLTPDGRFATTPQTAFHALWNKKCAGHFGIDETSTVGYLAGLHGLLTDK